MQHMRVPILLLAPLVALGCGDTVTESGAGAPLSHDISVGQLGSALSAGAARVEIKLESGSLVAREVELKTADEMADEESVRGRVSAVSATGDAGTLTFAIGDLEVDFTGSSTFRGAEGETLTLTEFAGRIQDAIDAGNQPAVRAKRPPPSEPQAPDDAAFEATDLRLLDGLESPKLELNVDADNFASNDTPPPDAWLLVLGLEIEIRSTTEIEADDDHGEETEVEGTVASVDVDGGVVTLTSGAVILIVDETTFDHDDEDDDEHLSSLDAVAQALTDGLTVKAEAEGSVQSTDPLTILAREVEFEIRNGDDDDGESGEHGSEIHGMVASVDLGAGSVTLEDGSVVLVDDETVFEHGDDDDEYLATLDAVAQALDDGKTVRVEAEGTVQSTDPLTVLAREVEFQIED